MSITHENLQEYIDKNASQSFGLSGNIGITSLDGITFPEKILYMQFFDMPIDSLTNVTFPLSIMSLTMNANNITTLKDVRFPPTMKTTLPTHGRKKRGTGRNGGPFIRNGS